MGVVNKIKLFFKKHFLESIFFVFIAAAIILDLVIENINIIKPRHPEIITILLPLVVTTLSIVLSLQRELIYGVTNAEFRKLRSDRTYNFLKIMLYSTTIIVLFVIASTLCLTLTIWVLNIITVIYVIMFSYQEIPILIKDKKRIKKIIKKHLHSNIGNTEVMAKGNNEEIVLQNLILKEGVISAYNTLKTKNNNHNKHFIDRILTVQNNYLFKFLEDNKLKIADTTIKYKSINITDAIDRVIENIEDIVRLNIKFNLVEIYGDESIYFQVTRALFSIRKILIRLELEEYLNKSFEKIIEIIFMKIGDQNIEDSNKKFLYNIINAMLINSLSNEDTWFLKMIKNTNYQSPIMIYGNIDYLVFISIYLYYIIELEDEVSGEFKDQLKEFINNYKSVEHKNIKTWVEVLRQSLRYLKTEDILNLLPQVLSIFDTNKLDTNWYYRKVDGVYSVKEDKTFSKILIINWWIGFVLTNHNIHIHFNQTQEDLIIPNLSKEDEHLLAVELNKHWFKDDELIFDKRYVNIHEYGYESEIDKAPTNTRFVKALIKFKNKNIEKSIKDDYKQTKNLEIYKKKIKEGFNAAVDNFEYLNKNIDLSDAQTRYITLQIDNRYSDNRINHYIKELPRALSRLLYEESEEKLKTIKNDIDTYSVKELQEVIKFEPTKKNAYRYRYKLNNEDDSKLVSKINEIPDLPNTWLPSDIFIKGNAISINFEYLEKESDVRHLKTEEIMNIINNNYKVINGLYKYEDQAKGSILLSKDKMIEIIKSKFFFVSIVFKYKTEFKKEDILYFKEK